MSLLRLKIIFMLTFLIPFKTQANDASIAHTRILTKADETTPSPEWLEYQRERFSNAKDVESLRKMLDPASQLLKNPQQITSPTPIQIEPQHPVKKVSKEVERIENTAQYAANLNDDADADADTDTDDSNDDGMRSKEGNTNLLMYAIKGIKYPTIRGLIAFIKKMKSSWVKQSKITIEQKINNLKHLKTRLMYLIEDQFSMIWTPKEYMRRRKRGLLDESNLNFPPEAALISINFLTFAVFLIKLVLQAVHIIKSKHYKLNGFGLTDGDTMTKTS